MNDLSKPQKHPRSQRPAPAPPKTRGLDALVWIGAVLAALAALGVGALLLILTRVHMISSLHPDEPVPSGYIGLTSAQMDRFETFVAVPAVALLIAMCFIFAGRVLRNGLHVRNTTGMQGGTFVAINPILAPRLHLMWVGVAVAFWVALGVVPAVSGLRGGWPLTVDYYIAQEYVMAMLAMYGGLAAAITAVLLASFLKKSRYLAMVEAEDPRMLHANSGFWRWMTFRWRFDLWLAGLGGMVVGIACFILVSGDVTASAIGMAIGAVLLGLGLWCSAQYWRGGVPLGAGESYV